MSWTTLCKLDEMPTDQGKYVEIDGFRLAVFLHQGEPSAIDDRCPHAGASLSAGIIDDGCAVCPRHAWMFQLSNGQMRGFPGVAVTRYPTRVHLFRGTEYVQADLPTP